MNALRERSRPRDPHPRDVTCQTRTPAAPGADGTAGTPPDIVATLNREIAAIIADPGFHERMTKIGVDVVGTTAAEYAKIISDDYAKWGKVAKAAGIGPQ
jgi:tripartite-type tricarboxylate transporter receptor subunit TctC